MCQIWSLQTLIESGQGFALTCQSINQSVSFFFCYLIFRFLRLATLVTSDIIDCNYHGALSETPPDHAMRRGRLRSGSQDAGSGQRFMQPLCCPKSVSLFADDVFITTYYYVLYYLYEMFAFFRWEIQFAMQLTFYGKVYLCNVTWRDTPQVRRSVPVES